MKLIKFSEFNVHEHFIYPDSEFKGSNICFKINNNPSNNAALILDGGIITIEPNLMVQRLQVSSGYALDGSSVDLTFRKI